MKFIKKPWFPLLVCLTVIATSCGWLLSEQEYFDENMLVGKWVNDSNSDDYYVFRSNYTGYMWDEGDDVSESEAMNDDNCAFTWALTGATLTILNSTTMTGDSAIPKVYTLKRLTETKLEYYDLFWSVSMTKCRNY